MGDNTVVEQWFSSATRSRVDVQTVSRSENKNVRVRVRVVFASNDELWWVRLPLVPSGEPSVRVTLTPRVRLTRGTMNLIALAPRSFY